jgi:hypothetical protein
MPWFGKEQPTPFDAQPIEGMKMLHGDVLARRYKAEWVRGNKYPLISFPSGLEREARRASSGGFSVHLFGRVELPYQGSRDEAFERIEHVASEISYVLSKQQQDRLMIINLDAGRGYQATYDNENRYLTDILHLPEYAMELLPGEWRAVLPKLYSNEKAGLSAVAPVKLFTPDSNWTWYPTEFDGDDLCFGLVSGFEVELGYFSITELESIRGGLGLPVERDLYFQPTTLQELIDYHNNQRR